MAALLMLRAATHPWRRHRRPPAAARPVEAVARKPAPARRAWRVLATARDTPGSLTALAAVLAGRGVNILSVRAHGVVDEFLVETTAGAEEIAAAVAEGGGRDAVVDRAELHDLVDVPAGVLATIARDVEHGMDLARSVRALLGDCELRWHRDGDVRTEGPDGTSMHLSDPEAGVLTVTRPRLAFTPAEYARARALLDLDRRFAELRRARRSVLLLPSGVELVVRRAEPADLPAILAMHDRCSERSRRQRYLAGSRPTTPELERMVSHSNGHTVVVEHAGSALVAMANLVWDGATAEAALLVEDAWQRQGIGTVMLRRLTTVAPTSGRPCHAVTELTNAPMLRALRRAGAELDHVDAGLAHLTIPTPDRALDRSDARARAR